MCVFVLGTFLYFRPKVYEPSKFYPEIMSGEFYYQSCENEVSKFECEEELHFSILNDGTMELQTKGGDYSIDDQLCYFRFGVETDGGGFEFVDLPNCPNSKESDKGKCITDCYNESYSIPPAVLPAKLKYIRIISASDTELLLNSKGKILTFSLKRVIENTVLPEVEIKTNSNGRMCLKIKTCPPKECTINYKDSVLEKFKKGDTCDNESRECTQYNNFLPYYEVHCQNLPIIVYNKVNKYTNNFEGSKLQFYPQRTEDENAVHLKFQNSMRGEMCLFKYKQGVKVGDVNDNTCAYQSKCGNIEGCCYSLCDDVFLNFDYSPPSYIKVVVYTRFTIGGANPKEICSQCIPQDKETTHKADLVMSKNLVTNITKSGFKMHAEEFKQNSDSFVSECKMMYMKADQPEPNELEPLLCLPKGKCKTECGTLDVYDLMSGTSFLVRMYDHGVTNVPDVRFEYFVVTKPASEDSSNNYDTSIPPTSTYTGFVVGLNNANDKVTNPLKYPSCRYFVSEAEKGAFTPAMCDNQRSCMGFCNEQLTIVGLKHSHTYDIKVDSNKYLGSYLYKNVKTLSVNAKITSSFEETQLIIEASFTSEGKSIQTKCEWIIYNVGNSEPVEISRCTQNQNCDPLPDCGSIRIENIDPNAKFEVHVIVPKFDDEFIHLIDPSKNLQIFKTEYKYEANKNSISIVGTIQPENESAMCSIQLFVAEENNNDYVKATECDSTEDNSCFSPQKCSKIVINKVLPAKKYKVLITVAETKLFAEIVLTTTSSIDATFTHEYNEKQLVITGKLNPEYESSKCEWVLKIKQNETLEDFKSCSSETKNNCDELPLCSSITIEDVEPQQDYQIEIKVEGTDKKFYYNIIKVQLESISFEIYHLYYGDGLLVGTKTEPPSTQTFKCGWILEVKNADQTYTASQKCVEDDLEACGEFPSCDKISIKNVDKRQSYRLTITYTSYLNSPKIIDITPGSGKGSLELPYTIHTNQLSINTQMFPVIDDAKCSWMVETRNEDDSFIVEKQCSTESTQDCAELPYCNNLAIPELTGEATYRVTVTVDGTSLSNSFTLAVSSTDEPNEEDEKSDLPNEASNDIKLGKSAIFIIIGVSAGLLLMAITCVIICMRRSSRGGDGLVMSDEY